MAEITQKAIEEFVDDAVGSRLEAVGEILDALADSIRATAQHVQEAWQDRVMARAWEKIAGAVDLAKTKYDQARPFNNPKLNENPPKKGESEENPCDGCDADCQCVCSSCDECDKCSEGEETMCVCCCECTEEETEEES